MRTIYKYGVTVGTIAVHDIPVGAKFLHAGPNPWFRKDDGKYTVDELAVWFEVESTAETEKRAFVVAGTGHELHPKSTYLGTVVLYQYAWHVQEIHVEY